jgi:hypothetical protein
MAGFKAANKKKMEEKNGASDGRFYAFYAFSLANSYGPGYSILPSR